MTEKPAGVAPATGLIDEAEADRRRAPELDLTQRAVPTPEQNERARRHPRVAIIFNDMLRHREEARQRWVEDCRRRSGVSWSGMGEAPPPPLLLRTFDEMIDEAIDAEKREAAFAVSPPGLVLSNLEIFDHRWPNVSGLAGEVRSCVNRGLESADERVAARIRLQDIQRDLQDMSLAASKALAVLDIMDAEARP